MSALTKVQELAERQGFLLDFRRRSGDVAPPRRRPAEGPWVAISRQAGSQGSELAVAVAGRLGWRTYDREILAAIAEETRRDEVVLRRFDERAVREFDEYLAPLIVPDDPGQARYLVEMTRVIARLAQEGRAVFVGRGARCILNPACGLSVRVIGPSDARAAEVARAGGVSLEDARRLVVENDEAQRAFIRQVFRKEIDDPAGFDLVVNVSAIGFEAAVQTVVAAAKAKLSP
jgi:hypothetical protein